MTTIEYLGSSLGSQHEPPDGVHALMTDWLNRSAVLTEIVFGYRVVEKTKGRPHMERVRLQSVRNARFVHARVKPEVGGNANCWIVSIPIPREIEVEVFLENLQQAANQVNGLSETQVEESQMRALHTALKGRPIELDRLKENVVIESGFPSLDWLRSALDQLASSGSYVVRNGAIFEWSIAFDELIRKDWVSTPSAPAETEGPIVRFVYALGPDGHAATELLGEIPALEETDGRPLIRIPNNFPLADDEREAFYQAAEGIRLLKAVGENVHGIQEQVWELDFAVYEEVLEIMESLGLRAPQHDVESFIEEPTSTSTETVTSGVEFHVPEYASPAEPEPDISDIRERLGTARARRASSIAEHNELQRQYQETVHEISEIAGRAGELNKQLKELNIRLNGLHQARAKLKERVKSTGREHSEACKEAKSLSIQLERLMQTSTEQTAVSIADLLREESQRTGITIDRLMQKLREKLR